MPWLALHSAPMVVGYLLASKAVIVSTPDSPASSASQNSSPLPSADTTPTPVTTTLGAPVGAIDTAAERVSEGVVLRIASREASGSSASASAPGTTSMWAEHEISSDLNSRSHMRILFEALISD